jgi:hypothetical protein
MTQLKGGKTQPLPVKPKAETEVDLNDAFIKFCAEREIPATLANQYLFYAGADTIMTELVDTKAFSFTKPAVAFLQKSKVLVDEWFIKVNLKGSEDVEEQPAQDQQG